MNAVNQSTGSTFLRKTRSVSGSGARASASKGQLVAATLLPSFPSLRK
jgi:hypothetical protein